LLAIAIAALVASCALRSAEPPPRPKPEPRVVSAPPDAATIGDADAQTGTQIRFEPAPITQSKPPMPHVEIQFPIAEQAISVDKAQKYKVRLKVENWPLGRDGRGVDLVLDDFGPRRVQALDPPPELGQLVPEDAKLEPGEHTLVAMAVRENGELVRPLDRTSLAPFALVHFWIGERGSARLSPSAPRLVYVTPRGTINGAVRADRVLVDFLPIGVELGPGKTTVVVRVRGEAASGTTILDAWRPVVMLDLPSGDYDIELMLVGTDGRPLPDRRAFARRTITVNRDAPTPAP
jgi:hypothetical protein